MKISARQYARALYEAVAGKEEGEINFILKNFVKILSRRNVLKKASEIIRELYGIFRTRGGVLEAEVTSSAPIKKESEKILKEYIARLSGAKNIQLAEKVDRGILGGVAIRYEDRVIDGSLRMKLTQLRHRMSK